MMHGPINIRRRSCVFVASITYIFSWAQAIGWEDCVEIVANRDYNSFVFMFEMRCLMGQH